ncbi:hypothetical protein [Leptospira perdikensis]|uniref:SinR family protein n=1 Tax=Leptospira perdikensis TaxID=2484948 RepID=A0A4R9JKF5_9LEPT|nr:hypothetical protein [Leptospira perdikensis]TGL45976.1 hypothetical protein EHQ49_00900 [Leptospira perdikensis]
MRAYILSYDRNPSKYDYKSIHSKITKNPMIKNWSHYLNSSYILISENNVNELSDYIRKVMPKHRFLLLEVDLRKSNGWLPQEAWDWINKNKIL